MFDAEVYGSPEAAAATAAAKDEGARMFILLIVFEPPVWLEYLGHAFGTHCSQKEAWHITIVSFFHPTSYSFFPFRMHSALTVVRKKHGISL